MSMWKNWINDKTKGKIMPREGLKKSGYRQGSFFVLLALLVALGSGALLVQISPSAQAQTAGTTINVFCIDYGKQFPTGQTITANGMAPANIQAALNYALSKDYITNNPYEVQLALWHLRDGQAYHDFENKGTAIAQEIVNNANSSAAPTNTTTASTNLVVTNIREFTADTGFGSGTIQSGATNTTIPVGILLPASGSTFQNLVGVTTGSANKAETTSAATTTETATTTAAPTTAAATATETTTATVATTTAAAQGGGVPTGSPDTGAGGSNTNDNTNFVLTLMSVVGFILAGLLGLAGLRVMTRANKR